MEQRKKAHIIRRIAQKAKSLLLRLPKTEGARKISPETQAKLNDSLIKAARNDEYALVVRLINAGASVNAKESEDKTVLQIAAFKGNKEICALLIEKGADVNAKDKKGMTALMIAAKRGYATFTCRLLIEKGSDVNATDSQGMTVLMWAAWSGDDSTCSLLLGKGVNMDIRNDDGKTALIFACIKEHTTEANILIKNGADVSIADKSGKTALDYCMEIIAAIKARDRSRPVYKMLIKTISVLSILNIVGDKKLAESNGSGVLLAYLNECLGQ